MLKDSFFIPGVCFLLFTFSYFVRHGGVGEFAVPAQTVPLPESMEEGVGADVWAGRAQEWKPSLPVGATQYFIYPLTSSVPVSIDSPPSLDGHWGWIAGRATVSGTKHQSAVVELPLEKRGVNWPNELELRGRDVGNQTPITASVRLVDGLWDDGEIAEVSVSIDVIYPLPAEAGRFVNETTRVSRRFSIRFLTEEKMQAMRAIMKWRDLGAMGRFMERSRGSTWTLVCMTAAIAGFVAYAVYLGATGRAGSFRDLGKSRRDD